MLRRYFKVWWMLAVAWTQIAFSSRFGLIAFSLGKILRFVFFFLFLVILMTKTKNIAGYTFWQVILFYATFNLLDTAAQFLWREVYRFRRYVNSGSFDYFLVKPISPLFRALFGGTDIMDFFVFLISIGFVVYSIMQIGSFSIYSIFIYILLVFNGLIIAMAFHILILVVGILSTEVENVIWLYRDLSTMARVPIDVYKEPVRSLLIFAIPLGVMMAFPVKAFLSLLSWQFIAYAFIVSFVMIFVSLWLWKYALREYSSASS